MKAREEISRVEFLRHLGLPALFVLKLSLLGFLFYLALGLLGWKILSVILLGLGALELLSRGFWAWVDRLEACQSFRIVAVIQATRNLITVSFWMGLGTLLPRGWTRDPEQVMTCLLIIGCFLFWNAYKTHRKRLLNRLVS